MWRISYRGCTLQAFLIMAYMNIFEGKSCVAVSGSGQVSRGDFVRRAVQDSAFLRSGRRRTVPSCALPSQEFPPCPGFFESAYSGEEHRDELRLDCLTFEHESRMCPALYGRGSLGPKNLGFHIPIGEVVGLWLARDR
jgi:hypothetical protein